MAEKRQLKLIPFSGFLKEPEEEIEYIVDELLPLYSIVLIEGRRGSFKMYLSLFLAKCISTGEAFLGWNTVKTSVVILDLENRPRLIKKRLIKLKTPESAELSLSFRRDIGRFNIETDYKLLAEACKDCVVIIDTFSKIHFRDENKNQEMNLIMGYLLNLIESKAIKALVLLHHQGKNVELGARGASAIEDNPDAVYELSRIGHSNVCSFNCIKHREAAEDTLNKILEFRFTKDEVSVHDITDEELNRFLSDLRELSEEQMNAQTKIIEALLLKKWKREKIRELLNKAVEKGILTTSSGLNNSIIYMFKHSEETTENCDIKPPYRYMKPKLHPDTKTGVNMLWVKINRFKKQLPVII